MAPAAKTRDSARTPVYYGHLNLPTCYRKPLGLRIADSHKGFPMSKFAIGEQVDNAADDHEGGIGHRRVPNS
jgi:hypothetical protein